jgi:uncharacterized membrane protein YuzA (DUF378 family)
MRIVSFISFLLTIIGALNWLLVGLVRFDLVRWIFGRGSLFGRIIYGLVGVGGLTQLTNYILGAMRRQPAPSAG